MSCEGQGSGVRGEGQGVGLRGEGKGVSCKGLAGVRVRVKGKARGWGDG